MAFIFLERHAKTNGFVFMEPSRQYREFAEECRRFAQLAKTDEQRKLCCKWKWFGRSLRKKLKDKQSKTKISWSPPRDRYHDPHLFRYFAPAPTTSSPYARKW